MKNNNLYNILTLILVVFTLSSCELDDRIIEPDEHESQLVLNANIYQEDTIAKITLTQSIGITDTVFSINNVELSNNNELTLHTPDQGAIAGFIYKEPSQFQAIPTAFWRFDYEDFIPGEIYEIEGKADGFETIRAVTRIPQIADLVDVKVDVAEAQSSYFVRDRFEITINDPGDEENFYFIEASREIDDQGYTSTRDYRFYDSPQNPIDESFLENVITVFSDKNFNGAEFKFIAYGERGSESFEEIEFKIYQISKESYEYQVAFSKASNNNPFSEPVTIPTNIENGFGVFAITSKPVTKIIKI